MSKKPTFNVGGKEFTAAELEQLQHVPFWMLHEAVASVRLDRDAEGGTQSANETPDGTSPPPSV